MNSIDIRTIQFFVNETQSVFLPEFSEILDISFDEWSNNLIILYQYNYELSRENKKMFNIWIMDSKNIMSPPSDFYKFFGLIERKLSEVNLANSDRGRIITSDTISKYYIFIEEIKTLSEGREEKLEKIL
jgi:hypothetical protein